MSLRFVPWCRLALALLLAVPSVTWADDPINHPEGNPGELPVGEDGQPLNFDFETGTLEDWTATGTAWDQQPFKGEIVTEITQAAEFYPAEDYHQDYYRKNPVRYKFYKTGCGRAARLKELWG